MTTATITDPSDGPESGVAPLSGPSTLRLVVEGWKFLPHSYSLVNYYQCIELLKRRNVDLFHRDFPSFPQLGSRVMRMMPGEEQIESIRRPASKTDADAVYRIGFPYNFSKSKARATFVFATCERMTLPGDAWVQTGMSLGETVEKNDIIIITPSEWSKRGFIRAGVPAERIEVVPHGVDTDVFRPRDPGERKADRDTTSLKDRFVFLNVSSLTGNKNPRGILRAFYRVVRKHPEALLILKGLNTVYASNLWFQNELNDMVGDPWWRLSRNTMFMGDVFEQQTMVRMYQNADAYVSPYQSEGFNLPVLEASACGLPLVVTGGGCTDEFVSPDFAHLIPSRLGDHEGDGSMWLRTSEDDIADGMERCIKDRAFTERARREGPLSAARFTWASAVDKLLCVIEKHLKGKA